MDRFLYSRLEAAIALGVSPRTMDYLIHQGKIETVPIGRKVMVRPEVLEEFARTGTDTVMPSKRKG